MVFCSVWRRIVGNSGSFDKMAKVCPGVFGHFRSFVPLDLPLASHWQLGKEPVKLPVKFMHITIRPTTAATILRLLGAIIVPLTILALSGYLRYVPR